jgi:xanthine dehydrogenase YagS FAD-binding subunit
MGTVGGNLCQEVTCWYYRRSPSTGRVFFCRRKGGGQCYAVAGDNRYHAIVGSGKCFAVCPSDLAPALVALNAGVKVTSSDGTRSIPLEDLYQPMGNILKPAEIITDIEIPWPKPNTRQRYFKFRVRKAIDFAIVSVAAVLTVEKEIVKNARIVFGGVAPVPYRAIAAEKELIGKPLDQAAALAAAEAAISVTKPLSMNRYKVQILKSLVKKAIIE